MGVTAFDPIMDREPAREIALPERLVARIEARLPDSGFDSTEAYVTFALEEVLVHVESNDQSKPEVDTEQVEARLESLGYLE